MSRFDPLIGHQKLLGSDFVAKLTDTTRFKSGRFGVSRHQLVRDYGTGNFLAAGNVLKACTAMKVTLMDLFKMPIREVAEIKGIGVTGVYVLLCIGHKRGVNIDNWLKGVEVTFHTLKEHVRDKDDEDKKRARSAKAKRQVALSEAGSHVLATRRAAKPQLAKSA